jgi:toxin ParE1/3/4
MAHRLAPRAEIDIDEIWYYVAKESSSVEIANRVIDTITDRFPLLADFPHLGGARDGDIGVGYRSLAVGEYIVVYCVEGDDVLILRVVHGRRNIEALFEREQARLRDR